MKIHLKRIIPMICSLVLMSCVSEPKTYIVTYKSNGAISGEVPADQIKVEGENLHLAFNNGNLEKDPYALAGWKDEDSKKFFDEGGIYKDNMDITLYADWRNYKRVEYDKNGATDGDVPATQNKCEDKDLVLAKNPGNLKKDGYVLTGWNTKADGTGDNYSLGSIFKKEEEVKLYAQWRIFTSKSSVDFVKDVKVGWNLGNTFDATGKPGLDCENNWGQPTTTKAMIEGVKNEGFKAIRIPVSWHDHVTGDDYTINSKWMARVKEVVDWAYNEGLYVIINIHHDNLSEKEIESGMSGYTIAGTDETYYDQSKKYITCIWKQIAQTFNDDYDEHLIFELLNEPRAIGYEIDEWWIQNDTQGRACQRIITEFEQSAIDVIRESGGNNSQRFIMVPSYAASVDFLSFYDMPIDTADDKLIISAHSYSPYNFAMYDEKDKDKTFDSSDEASLNSIFTKLTSGYIDRGIGVIIGETGATNKNNLEERVKWGNYFFDKAYEKGMPSFLWDNGGDEGSETSGEKYGFYNREKQTWYFPEFMEAILNK